MRSQTVFLRPWMGDDAEQERTRVWQRIRYAWLLYDEHINLIFLQKRATNFFSTANVKNKNRNKPNLKSLNDTRRDRNLHKRKWCTVLLATTAKPCSYFYWVINCIISHSTCLFLENTCIHYWRPYFTTVFAHGSIFNVKHKARKSYWCLVIDDFHLRAHLCWARG